jgi:hypothetical protein
MKDNLVKVISNNIAQIAQTTTKDDHDHLISPEERFKIAMLRQ